jgi:hypothetical protein
MTEREEMEENKWREVEIALPAFGSAAENQHRQQPDCAAGCSEALALILSRAWR